MKKQINTDTRFQLQQIDFKTDEWGTDYDNPIYLEPTIYFNNLIEYHDIVKKYFNESKHFLELTEYFHNSELIHESEYFNDINHCMMDSMSELKNEDLEKLNNTLDSIKGDGGYQNSLQV